MKNIYVMSFGMLFAASVANAQDRDGTDGVEASAGIDHPVAAASSALELGVATGYTQGAGPVGGGMQHLQDITGAGGAVEIDAMYRINPTVAVGLFGTFSSYSNGDLSAGNSDIFGASAGIQAAFHFRPDRSIDPWVSVGTGWRSLWLSPQTGKNTSLQGLELARLQLGVDYRLGRDVAISPVVSGAIDMFLAQDGPMTTDYDELSNKKINFVGFAGLAGRFDTGGRR
ncbi:MAG TPA: hypothetical protein VGC41_13740 [Kofleriaceae bacterium]